jgi:hypothetical protein
VTLQKFSTLFLLIFSLFFVSCSKEEEDEFDDAILEANFLLSEGDCAGAISVLEGVGSSASTSSLFLQVYASAYACSGGYSDLDFFGEAATKLNAGSTDFLNSLATFDYSVEEASAESADFQNLMEAIDIITTGGGNTSGDHTGRLAIFGTDDTQSLNLQALFMVAGAIGKYVHYYTDAVASTGIKSQCVYTYTKAISRAAIDAAPASACNGAGGYVGGNSGVTDDAIRRACQGVVLYNQMIDLFLNTTLTNSDDYGDLDLVYANISTAYDTFCETDANTQAMCDLKTVQGCIDDYDDSTISIDYIELYLAAIIDATML